MMFFLFTSVCAFQSSTMLSTRSARTTPKMAVEDLAGVTSFPGFFDPIGISEGKSDARIKYFREAELKHGRVAMLASVGFLVAEKFHPLFGGGIDEPSYVAFQATPLQKFWPIVLAVIGWVEYLSIEKFNVPGEGFWTLKAEYENGDLGFDPLGLKPTDPDELKTMQTKELNNGRLAMLGIAGMVAQELVSKSYIF